MGNRSMFVGLDVHKETIDVPIAVRALRAPDRQLHFVYEAGPCSFGVFRHLIKRDARAAASRRRTARDLRAGRHR